MKKKVLVFTLVLVLALASSAAADIKFSGKFNAGLKQDGLKVFVNPYEINTSVSFSISADQGGDAVDWDFGSSFGWAPGGALVWNNYHLSLFDDYFTGHVWGSPSVGKWLDAGSIGSYFGMLTCGGWTEPNNHYARLSVPILDVADIHIQLQKDQSNAAKQNTIVVAQGTVADVDLQLMYALRKTQGGNYKVTSNWVDGDYSTALVQAGYGLELGDAWVDLKGAVGLMLINDVNYAWPDGSTENVKDKTALGIGFGADADITDELSANLLVTKGFKYWLSDWESDPTVAGEKMIIRAGATYTEELFQVTADGRFDLDDDAAATNPFSFGLGAKYRMSDSLGYAALFDADGNKWAGNDAPAFGLSANFSNAGFDGVTLNVTSPVLEDMIWLWLQGSYAGANTISARLRGLILATDKLTLLPNVGYAQAGNVIDINLDGTYLVGDSGISLGFGVWRTINAVDSGLKLNVSVPF